MAYLGVPFIPSSVYHFTVSVLRIYRHHRKFVWTSWIFSSIFSAASIGTDAVITGVHKFYWGYYPAYGWPGLLMLIFFLVMIISSLICYLLEYRRQTSTLQKLRTRSFLWAFSISFIGSVDFLPKFGIPVYPFGYLPVFIFIILLARSIWRYHLEDITPAFAAERIIRTMSDALLVLDREGIIRVVNKAAIDLLQTRKHDLIGRRISVIMDNKLFHDHYASLMESGTTREFEISFKDRQDRNRIFSHSMSVMRDRINNPIAIVCIIKDITGRKLAEEDLNRHRYHLEEMVRERTDELKKINRQLEQEISERRQIEEELKESEKRYRFLVENQNDLIIKLDADFRITFISPNCLRIFGKTEDGFIGNNFFRIFNKEQQERLGKTVKLFLEKSPHTTYHENQIETLEGERCFGWSSSAVVDENGKISEIVTVGRDTTKRRKAEERMKISHKILINLLDSIDAIVYVADINTYEILYVNKHTRNIFGDIRGRICWQALQNRQSGPCDFCTNSKLLTPEGEPGDVCHWEFHNKINSRWYDARDRAIEWIDGRIVRLEIATDITELKEAEEMLRSMSFIDDLTGLYNRRGFMTLAQQQLKVSIRVKCRMLLLFCDLDNMKWINDSLGHIEGDRALINVGKILKETFRESDIIARIGGDEFVILAIETPEINPDSIAGRLQSHIDSFNEKEKFPYNLSLSLGIVHYDPEFPQTLEDLLTEADALMYRHKKSKQTKQ